MHCTRGNEEHHDSQRSFAALCDSCLRLKVCKFQETFSEPLSKDSCSLFVIHNAGTVNSSDPSALVLYHNYDFR